jgi:5-(carboxyamino)imidazole ribonucleotide synthase
MSALAAIRMGIRVKTLSPSPSGPVADIGESHVGDWNDTQVMADFVRDCDVVTVESEWAPAELAETVRSIGTNVWPSSETLTVIRHKGRQKAALETAGIPVPEYRVCATLEEARHALHLFGGKVVAKRFEGSYDGYGNATVTSEEDMIQAWADLSANDGLLVESFVPFIRELAVMVARSASGECVVYPVVDTEQKNHRCHAVTAPAPITDQSAHLATDLALKSADAVSIVGLLGVELFELEDGTILVNELAPRPHNTGHYTIEACHTSQFENHVRSILNWPLGDPSLQVPAAVMINVLGKRAGLVEPGGMMEALSVPGAAVHIYGKKEARPDRKMGHVTVTADDAATARKRAEEAAASITL